MRALSQRPILKSLSRADIWRYARSLGLLAGTRASQQYGMVHANRSPELSREDWADMVSLQHVGGILNSWLTAHLHYQMAVRAHACGYRAAFTQLPSIEAIVTPFYSRSAPVYRLRLGFDRSGGTA